MPPLLTRYILSDLFRTTVVTTAVIVTVIAFGAAIKPLTHESFLNAFQLLKYIGLAIVPMLQFALPFAAGFSATIVLNRMVNDNEVLAMRAAGISYLRLLTPVAGLGVALSLAMVLLTQTIIPRFWELMEQTIAEDITLMLEASIDRGQPYSMQGMQIYADDVMRIDVDDPDGPDLRMRLMGVAAAELDDHGRIRTDVTAREAVLDIFHRDDQTFIKLRLLDAVAYNYQTDELLSLGEYIPRRAIPVPNKFANDPMFMSRGELIAALDNPDLIDRVAEQRDKLASELDQLRARREIHRLLVRDGQLTFRSASHEADTYIVRANGLDGAMLIPEGDRITVNKFEDGQPTRIIEAEQAELSFGDQSPLDGDRRIALLLENCDVRDAQREGIENSRNQMPIPDLMCAALEDDAVLTASSAELLDLARDGGASSTPQIDALVAALEHQIEGTQRSIEARLQRRYALSVTAMLLLLLGSIMAMTFRDVQPLTVYLWAFLPSVLDLLLISGGDQLMRDGKSYGIAVMWSGNAVLIALATPTFLKLRRN